MLFEETPTKLPSVMKLNVGGVHYVTRLATLQKYPESMLGAMFSGRYKMDVDEEGRYFIDRNGKHFNHVLEFLRDDHYLPPPEMVEVAFREANYYAISEFREKLLLLPPLFPFGDNINREDPIDNYKDLKTKILELSRKNATIQDVARVYLLCLNKVKPEDADYPDIRYYTLGHHIKEIFYTDTDLFPELDNPLEAVAPTDVLQTSAKMESKEKAIVLCRCLEYDFKKEGYIVKFDMEPCLCPKMFGIEKDNIDQQQALYWPCHFHAKFLFVWPMSLSKK